MPCPFLICCKPHIVMAIADAASMQAIRTNCAILIMAHAKSINWSADGFPVLALALRAGETLACPLCDLV